jgi:hypothetical protein
LALACAGATAAPTVTVLMTSAAAIAMSVRVAGDLGISISLFDPEAFAADRCPLLFKGRANP